MAWKQRFPSVPAAARGIATIRVGDAQDLHLSGTQTVTVVPPEGVLAPYEVLVSADTSSSNDEDKLAGWQLILEIQPSESANGILSLTALTQPKSDNVLESPRFFDARIDENGRAIAFAAEFPFVAGSDVPVFPDHDSLIEFHLQPTTDTYGRFDLVALEAPQSVWTHASQPFQLEFCQRRQRGHDAID